MPIGYADVTKLRQVSTGDCVGEESRQDWVGLTLPLRLWPAPSHGMVPTSYPMNVSAVGPLPQQVHYYP